MCEILHGNSFFLIIFQHTDESSFFFVQWKFFVGEKWQKKNDFESGSVWDINSSSKLLRVHPWGNAEKLQAQLSFTVQLLEGILHTKMWGWVSPKSDGVAKVLWCYNSVWNVAHNKVMEI